MGRFVCFQRNMLWRQTEGLKRAKLALELCGNLALIIVNLLEERSLCLIGISISI